MSKQYQVGEFKVRVREAALGPLVWGYAKRDSNGQRHLLDLPLEPEALPPAASESQLATLAGRIIYSVVAVARRAPFRQVVVSIQIEATAPTRSPHARSLARQPA